MKKVAVILFAIAAISILAFSRNSFSMEEELKEKISDEITEEHYTPALKMLDESLRDNEDDIESLKLLIELIGDSHKDGVYDPVRTLKTYEQIYRLTDSDSDESAVIMNDALNYWNEYTENLKSEVDIYADQEKIFKKVTGKQIPVILFIYADWCPASRDMKSVLEAIRNGGQMGKTLLIEIEMEDYPFEFFKKKYSVEHYPTVVFIDRNGNEVRHVGGIHLYDIRKILKIMNDFFHEEKLDPSESFNDEINKILN